MSAGEWALLPAGGHRRMRWKNGLGWTSELAREPADEAAEFGWRVSVAEVDADCEFSEFAGVDRSILVVSGAGMALDVGEGPVLVTLDGPALAFAGEGGGRCRLLAGPIRDFNVMTRRGVYVHSLARVNVDGEARVACRGGETLVYVTHGEVEAAGRVLAAGDCLRGGAVPEDSLCVRGVGSLVVARLDRR